MRQRFAEYGPASARHSGSRLFRSVRLNAAGWSAVIALCLGGALMTLACLVAVDRRRHARLTAGAQGRGGGKVLAPGGR